MPTPTILQLNMLGAHPQEEGPFTRVEVFREGDTPAYLFIVCEATGPYVEEVCEVAASLVVDEFLRGRESVTGRLQRALTVVHRALLQENTLSLQEHRSRVNVVCAYLREHEVYVAHGGPAFAYVLGARPRSLAPVQADPGPPLGGDGAQVWVRRHVLSPGEKLLLTSSLPFTETNPDGALAALQKDIYDGMTAVYRGARKRRSFGALAIEPDIGLPAAPDTEDWGEDAEDAAPASAAGFGNGRRPYSYQWSPPRPGPPPVAAPPPSALGGGQPSLFNLSLDLRTPLLRTRRSALRLHPGAVAGIAGAILLAIGVITFVAAAQDREAQNQAEAATLLGQATDLMARADQAGSRNDRRELLNQALEHIEQSASGGYGGPQARELAERARQELTQMNAVRDLREPRSIIDIAVAPPNSVLFRDLVVLQNGLFLVDKKADRVVQVPPAPAPGAPSLTPTPYYPGRLPNRRNIDTLLWMPRGGAWPRDSLMVLDDSRGLHELVPGQEPRSLKLRGADQWSSFQTAVGFDGNLYVLDPRASQVWRYIPTDTGFDTERRPALPSADLRDAVDLAVDGDTYVLLKTGNVKKFSEGREQPFSQDGIDTPLAGPVALFTAPATRALYVVDPGNDRVVVFDKEGGAFLRQHPLADLPRVHSLSADEKNGVLYLATDSQVFVAGMGE